MSIQLTQDTDECIGQEVSVLIGGITLVNCAGADLHITKDDDIFFDFPTVIRR